MSPPRKRPRILQSISSQLSGSRKKTPLLPSLLSGAAESCLLHAMDMMDVTDTVDVTDMMDMINAMDVTNPISATEAEAHPLNGEPEKSSGVWPGTF